MVTTRTRAALLGALLALAGVSACSDDPSSTGDVQSLRVSSPNIFLDVGESVQLEVVGVTSGGQTIPVSGVAWNSLDPDVATVDEGGVARGIAEGVARIVASAGAIRDTFRLSVGGVLNFNVSSANACNTAVLRDARIVATSEHAIVAEDISNPAGGFSDADYESIAVTFDTLIFPVVTSAFGLPQDIDANDRVVILYTSAVNELTPPDSRSFVAGFFFSRDLFPTESRDGLEGCETSNQAELFYMLAPDPEGEVNGNKRTREFVLERTLGTIGHEFQHLINASRRLFESEATAFETVWLNEGLSHIAEELLFYEASGLAPGQNLDVTALRARTGAVTAFNLYGGGNFGRLAEYMSEPSGQSPYERDDDLATRGATWSFLRYAADRSGRSEASLWRSLSGSADVGFANLDAAFGTSMRRWVADWAVANATDRFAVKPSAAEQFRHQSWNQTQILGELDLTLLKTHPLSSGGSVDLSLTAGGSGHVRFRVGSTAATVASALSGNSAPSCTGKPNRSLGVGEVVQGTLSELGAICLQASLVTTQDFILTATHLASTEGATVTVRVTGSGLSSAPAASVISSSGGPSLELARALDIQGDDVAVNFERKLRRLEQSELGWRMAGGSALRPELQTSGGGSDVILSLLRTR